MICGDFVRRGKCGQRCIFNWNGERGRNAYLKRAKAKYNFVRKYFWISAANWSTCHIMERATYQHEIPKLFSSIKKPRNDWGRWVARWKRHEVSLMDRELLCPAKMNVNQKRNSRHMDAKNGEQNRWSCVQVSHDIPVCTSAAICIWKNQTSYHRSTSQIVSRAVVSQGPAHKSNNLSVTAMPGSRVLIKAFDIGCPSVYACEPKWLAKYLRFISNPTMDSQMESNFERSTGVSLVPGHFVGIGKDNLSSFC